MSFEVGKGRLGREILVNYSKSNSLHIFQKIKSEQTTLGKANAFGMRNAHIYSHIYLRHKNIPENFL